MLNKIPNRKAFTLLEVLLVIAILAVLAGIVILAINPSKQLAESNNAQRRSDVNTILNAVYQYSLDNNGALPTGITATDTEICATGATCGTLVDLSVLTTNETYIISIPNDPTGSSATGSGYFIQRTPGNRVRVSAPSAELGVTIEVSR